MTQNDGSLLGFEGPTITYATDKFGLGETVWHNDIEYIFCAANVLLPKGTFTYLSSSFFLSTLLATSTAIEGQSLCVPQVDVASGRYAWFAVQGRGFVGKVAASFAAFKSVYTTATAGTVDDEPSGTVKLNGVRSMTGIDADGLATFAAANRLFIA